MQILSFNCPGKPPPLYLDISLLCCGNKNTRLSGDICIVKKVLLTTMNSIAVDKNNKQTIPFLSTDSQFYLANANGIKQERDPN